ncbi:MAG: hypothetical protein ABEJ35_00555 [Halobacteriaceae archaeon]
MRLRAVSLRLVIALAVLGLLGLSIEPRGIATALHGADRSLVALAFIAGLFSFVVWGAALRILLDGVEAAPRGRAFVGGYALGVFLRSVVPWGRAGGAVFTAYGLDRVSVARYERLLAATLSSDLLKFVASMSIATAGLLVRFVAGGVGGQLLPLATASAWPHLPRWHWR